MTYYERLINGIHKLNAEAEGEPVEMVYRRILELKAEAEAALADPNINGDL